MRRLLELFTPINYKLQLTIDREQETIDGEVLITGVPHASQISLHAKSLSVSSVQIVDAEASTDLDFSLDPDTEEPSSLSFPPVKR